MKNKKVYALSQPEFLKFLNENSLNDDNIEEKDISIIQIGNTDKLSKEFYEFALKENQNVLSLNFDDCDEKFETQIIGGLEYVSQTPMSEEQAKQIIDFVEVNKNKSNFIIHCHAGISRSGGVAEAISTYFDNDYFYFREMNPKTRPNVRIKVMILNLAFKK